MIKENVTTRGSMDISQRTEWDVTHREYNADKRRPRAPFPLKCTETQRPRLQDLPYCRHMALRWDTVCLRVCVCRQRGRRKGEGIRVSNIDLPQGSLGNYREAGQLHHVWFFGTYSMVKCSLWDLLLLYHYVSRLLIVYFCCPAYGFRPKKGKRRPKVLTVATTFYDATCFLAES